MRELPSHVPYDAVAALVIAFQSKWEGIAHECLNRVRQSLLVTVLGCIHKRFKPYEYLQQALV
jgi:hypothetical protein